MATALASFAITSPPPPPRPRRSPISSSPARLNASFLGDRVGSVRCGALGEGSRGDSTIERCIEVPTVHGRWTHPTFARSGLVTAATSFVIAASAAFLPEGNIVGDIVRQDIDLLYVIGASGLGLSLFLIHIYVTPIKRFLQALWAIGVLGSIGTYATLAQPHNESLVQYAIDNPAALWLIGPLFAALTGLVFKEGLCYGKLEAGVLTFVIPGLLLGHLSTLMDNGTKLSLLGLWMALFLVFAARKFQQPIKDDIGDKSVFMFNALPEEEKEALLQKLEQITGRQLD